MRILQCLPSLEPAYGGPARSVPQLAGALADRGNTVAVWTPTMELDIGDNFPSALIVQRLSGRFDSALKAFGPDLVHDNGIWRPCHHRIASACTQLRIPRIVSPRGMLEPWALRYKKWKKSAAWWLYQRHDLWTTKLLHATAQSESNNLRRLKLNRPIVELPNGIGMPPNQPASCKSICADEKRHALFLSRLHPSKGLGLLVEAWARVRPKGWALRVVGPDTNGYKSKILQQVTRAGLAAEWSFEEMANETTKWRLMREADLFILPSFSENFGIVVAEALAAGVPVITTKGTPWAQLTNRRCGWWVDINIDALAGALREATTMDRRLLLEMGGRGRCLIDKEYKWPQIVTQMVEAYTWALQGGAPPNCILVE